MTGLERALEVAVAAALECGGLLRADLHRSGGPRGKVDKAEADTEAERLARARLLDAFPDWSYLGEETGAAEGRAGAPRWLVDPNDGTRDYLKGRRGSAVSIGLLVEGAPRLGVVFAFAYPDDEGDLFAWAEGCGPLRRNGTSLGGVRLPASLAAQDVVLVSSGADRNAAANLACVAPARFRAVPSVAHRLALVASGEAAAAVSLHGPGDWDYGAGHALLRAVGATLVDEQGEEVVYGPDGRSRCRWAFGGRDSVARTLAERPWRSVEGWGDRPPSDFPVRLEPGSAVSDAGRLSRAQACLLGSIAGASRARQLAGLGAGDETSPPGPSSPPWLADAGGRHALAGQPDGDGELGLALARSLVAEGCFDRERVRSAYVRWLRSGPFDVSGIAAPLSGGSRLESPDAGVLVRTIPLAVLGHALPPESVAALVREDVSLTHAHPWCGEASGALLVAAAHAIGEGASAQATWRAAMEWAWAAGLAPAVLDALSAARDRPASGPAQPALLAALQNAFHELLHAPDLERGTAVTIGRQGDAETSAAAAGALLGAVHGRAAIPEQWRSMVLSCRPHGRNVRGRRPRACWPVDVMEIAERLLISGEQQALRSGKQPA